MTAEVAIGRETDEQRWHEAMDSLRQAVRQIHANAVYLYGEEQQRGNELRIAAHNIVQAVLLMTGERVPQSPEEESLYTACPVCQALPGQNCVAVPGHPKPGGSEFHNERVEMARDHVFRFLAERSRPRVVAGRENG